MEFTDPFELTVPPGAGRLGEAPFWSPGAAVTWTYRRFDFDIDHVEVRRPMRVIEDGPLGAVLWMPGGTAVTDTRLVGWEGFNAHDVPLDVRFRPRAEAPHRYEVPAVWQGHGVLKIAPPHAPFSVWVLVKPAEATDRSADRDHSGDAGRPADAGRSADASADADRSADTERHSDPGRGESPVTVEWYINLETVHCRTAEAVYTSDLILDITFPVPEEPLHAVDGSLSSRGAVFKDVHEITAAGEYGYWPREWSDIVRTNGALVLDRLEEFRWAFDPKWESLALELAGFGEGPAGFEAERAGLGPESPSESLLLGPASIEAADPAVIAPDDRVDPDDRAYGNGAAASANEISAGQREHRRIPAGCYTRPDSR
ncbi:hypothetical protein KACC15558_24310 [Brevibacterium ammoniilyticum]|uniref:DUF402 domain-containing protein n=1 Tax=Brevibacterium ammoniilyticum TaxID=1046555 RepID=A0ABP9U914_9MICO